MKIKINPSAITGEITDSIIRLLYEGAEHYTRSKYIPVRSQFYWSIDLALKPLIKILTDGNGWCIYVSNFSKKFLRACPTCLQDVFEVEIREILIGVDIVWDGVDNEIELKLKGN